MFQTQQSTFMLLCRQWHRTLVMMIGGDFNTNTIANTAQVEL